MGARLPATALNGKSFRGIGILLRSPSLFNILSFMDIANIFAIIPQNMDLRGSLARLPCTNLVIKRALAVRKIAGSEYNLVNDLMYVMIFVEECWQ